MGIALLLFITPALWGGELSNGHFKDTIKRDEPQIHATLKKVLLQSSIVPERDAPLRVTSIDERQIELKSPAESYPELLKAVPGVYSTAETGSFGDAKINIRGFKQENLSILLNGIPISGLVTGNMFWNNWLGLSDATQTVKVEKGIGSSMLSDNSVGATINIITKGVSESSSFNAAILATQWGLLNSSFAVSSGKLRSGWSLSLHASYTTGSSFPEATDVRSGSYMVNISKEINRKSSFLLTLLGSPDRHAQRTTRLSYSEVEERGLHYNKNWGLLAGEQRSLSENFYHKPYLTLNYRYTPTSNLELAVTSYFSVGDGGGAWSESKGKRIIEFQEGGQIDWEEVIEFNRRDGGEALNILSNYLAGHTQIGVHSSIKRSFQNWKIESGIHYQHFTTWEKEQISDLLGGGWWLEEYDRFSLAGVAGREERKGVGDYIRTYNGKIIDHLTLYSAANYQYKGWRATIGVSLMGSFNRRWDKYNYLNNILSERAIGKGASIKGGVHKRVTNSYSLYLNGALYRRAPYHNIYFASGNNNITEGVKEEVNVMVEGGVRYISDRVTVEVGTYHSLWKNKSLISSKYSQPDQSDNRYMVQGLNALHSGVEATAGWQASHWASFDASLSIGYWRWLNDVAANIYHPYSGELIEQINIYTKGLPVGDAPQFQLSLSSHLKPTKGMEIILHFSHFAANWADYNPSERVDPLDRAHSYKIPNYSLIDVVIQQRIKIIKERESRLFIKVNNLTNKRYIERGLDGIDHTLDSFRGFWGLPRYLSLGIRL